MGKQHPNFWIDFLSKIGPPIFSATLVGCLLANKFELIHVILFSVSFIFIGGTHWYTFHRSEETDKET